MDPHHEHHEAQTAKGNEMHPDHKDLIQRKQTFLLDNLTICTMFLSCLVSCYILNFDEQEELMKEHLTMRRKVGRFCEIIVRKGPKAFDSFMRALVDTHQSHVRDELLQDLPTGESAALRAEKTKDIDIDRRGASQGKTTGETHGKTEQKTGVTDTFRLSVSDVELMSGYISFKTGDDGLTAAQAAVNNGNVNLLSFFIKAGADMDVVDDEKQNLLHRAARGGHVNTVDYLIKETQLSVNSVDKEYRTPLHVSIMSGNPATSRHLIECQADIQMVDTNKRDPLYLACMFGDLDTARILLDKGAVYTTKTSLSNTALDTACIIGYIDVARLLLERGADVNVCRDDGATPLYVACQEGHAAVAELLLSWGAHVDARLTNGATPLYVACQNGHAAVAELLLSRGAHVDSRRATGSTPLFVASQEGHREVVERLLAWCAVVDARAAGRKNSTPLHVACYNGWHSVVSLLLEKGADINARDEDDDTPLHVACLHGWHSVVRLLLEKGADINAQNVHDDTPLHAACLWGQTRTVHELLQHPTLKTHIVNKNYQTARRLAEARGHKEILEMLPNKKRL